MYKNSDEIFNCTPVILHTFGMWSNVTLKYKSVMLPRNFTNFALTYSRHHHIVRTASNPRRAPVALVWNRRRGVDVTRTFPLRPFDEDETQGTHHWKHEQYPQLDVKAHVRRVKETHGSCHRLEAKTHTCTLRLRNQNQFVDKTTSVKLQFVPRQLTWVNLNIANAEALSLEKTSPSIE